MKLRPAVCLIALLSLLPYPIEAKEKAPGEERLDGKKVQLARYAKAFIGQGNITVEVAPYKSDGKEGAILLFKGIESDWDGKAINHSLINGGKDYATTVKGKPWVSLGERNGTYTLYVPDLKEEVTLAPSDGAAQLTTPQAIYKTYIEQKRK
jgi:hypothetical protein